MKSVSSLGRTRRTLALIATVGYVWTHYLTSTPAKCLMNSSRDEVEEEVVNTENLRPLEVTKGSSL